MSFKCLTQKAACDENAVGYVLVTKGSSGEATPMCAEHLEEAIKTEVEKLYLLSLDFDNSELEV